MAIRRCEERDRDAINVIVNAAAQAYRGVIPADRWHEPYMDRSQLDREFESGVEFWGCERDGALVAVMGVQDVGEVDLIRHAYVLPERQRGGLGAAMLEHLMALRARRALVGTWAAADWAVRFYERHGFVLVPSERVPDLLRRYWDIPERQIETSVVLANPPLEG